MANWLGPGYAPMPDSPWRPMVRRGFYWHANWAGAKLSIDPARPFAKWQALVGVVTLRLFRVVVIL